MQGVWAMIGQTMQQSSTSVWTIVMMMFSLIGSNIQVRMLHRMQCSIYGQHFGCSSVRIQRALLNCLCHCLKIDGLHDVSMFSSAVHALKAPALGPAGGRKYMLLGMDVTWLTKLCPWCPCWIPPEW
jgi:hypothetical protein